MNVYVRELVSALAQAGVDCTTYTRASRQACPKSSRSSRATAWCTSPPAPSTCARRICRASSTTFADGVVDHLDERSPADVLHANYWLSGLVGHRLKHELDRAARQHLPHPRQGEGRGWRLRAAAGANGPRPRSSAAPMRSASAAPRRSASSAACTATRRDASRSSRPASSTPSSPPATGAVHARALGLPADVPVLLFVGRIQPLKGPDVAVRGARRSCSRPDALLLVVGGASGLEGGERGRPAARA